MDLYKAIRLKALRSVLYPDRDYIIRRTMRWYAKTFHTDLRLVEEMPLEEVFQAYYEEKYAAMSDEDLDREREELVVTDEQRYEQILQEEAEEVESFELARIMAAEEAAAKKKAAKKASAEKIADIQHVTPEPLRVAEADLPAPLPTALPPDITMSFVSDADFEAELDGFGQMGQPTKP